MLRPAAAAGGTAALAASALLAAGLFVFRDDYLMTRVAASGEADPGELLRLTDLGEEMRASGAFDEARLLRLRGAFVALDRPREVRGLNELLVTHAPATPAGRFRKAESLMELGRHREAEPIFASLLTDLDAFPMAWTRRECVVAAGRCAANLGDYALAADRFGRYVELDGPVDAVRTEWAGLLARSGDRAKAIRVLTGGTRRLAEMPADQRRLLAPLHLAAHDTAAAAEVYRSLLADDPNDTGAALGLARVALDAGEEGATEAFRVFLAEHPDDPAARLGLARSLTADGAPAAAEESLRELLAEDPGHPTLWPLYLSLVTDPAHAAIPVEAGGAGGDGVTVGPPQRAVVAAIAQRRDELGAAAPADEGAFLLQLIAAVRAVEADSPAEVAELGPIREQFAALPAVTATQRLRRAEVLTDLGRHAGAAAALDELFADLAADPALLPNPADRVAARLAAARSAARLGRFGAAHARFEAALAAGAAAAPIRAERAGVLAELDRPAEALAVLTANLPPAGAPDSAAERPDEHDEEAKERNNAPGEGFAPPLTLDERVQLAGLRSAAGDPETAAADLAEVVAERPGHRPAVLLLADLSMGLERYPAAARLYAEAVALDPAEDAAAGDRAAIARGWALTELGEFDAAEGAFRALLNADADRPELWQPYLAALAAATDAAEIDAGATRIAGTAEVAAADAPLAPERRAAVRAILARRDAKAGDGSFLLQLIAAARRANVPEELRAVRTEFAALPAETATDRLRRAEVLTALDRHEEAAGALDELWAELEADPFALPLEADRIAARVAAARSAAFGEKWETAADRFAVAVAAGADPAAVRSQRAGALAELGRPADAVAVLAAPSRVPLNRAERGQLGGLHAAAGDYEAAQTALAELLAEDADDLAVTRLLADVSVAAGRHRQAARLYDRVVELDPAADAADGDRARIAAAYALSEAGDPAAAEAALRGLLTDAPDRPTLWPAYLAAFAAAVRDGGIVPDGSHRSVVAAIDARRAEFAGDGTFLLQLIAASRALADSAEDSVLAAAPTDRLRAEFTALPARTATDRLRRAEVLTDLDRHADAARLLDDLWDDLALNPAALPDPADRVEARVAAARSAGRLGEFAEAERRFAAAVAAGADPDDVRSERAGVLFELGRPADGAAVLAAGLGSDPFAPMNLRGDGRTARPLSRDERVQLAGLHAAAGHLAAAADVLSGLVAEAPDDRDVTLLLADVSAGLKRFPDAARYYERAVRLDPAADRADGDRARIAAALARSWGGDARGAEWSLRQLLLEEFDRPHLWTPYLESAGMLKALPPAAKPLIAALWEQRGRMAGDERFLLTLAAAAHRGGETDRVVELLTELTAAPDTTRDLLEWLAASLDTQGRFDEAAEVYDRLLKLPPDSLTRESTGDKRESGGESAGDRADPFPAPRLPAAAAAGLGRRAGRGGAGPRRAAAVWPVGRW